MVQPMALGPFRCFTSADGLGVFDDRAPAEIQHMGRGTHLAVVLSNEHRWEGLQTLSQGSLDGPYRRNCKMVIEQILPDGLYHKLEHDHISVLHCYLLLQLLNTYSVAQ